MFQLGSEIECQEVLHGKLHSMHLRPTGVDPGKCLEYEIPGWGKGAFEAVPKGEEIEFVAELDLGSAGYILRWPSWYVLEWLVLFAAMMHRMVLTEEEHLRCIHGGEFEQY